MAATGKTIFLVRAFTPRDPDEVVRLFSMPGGRQVSILRKDVYDRACAAANERLKRIVDETGVLHGRPPAP